MQGLIDTFWGYRFFRRVRRLPRREAWAAARRLAGYVVTFPELRDRAPMFRRPWTGAEAFAVALLIWSVVLVGALVGPAVTSRGSTRIHAK